MPAIIPPHEDLLTCPVCHIRNFTLVGLRNHVCRGKSPKQRLQAVEIARAQYNAIRPQPNQITVNHPIK